MLICSNQQNCLQARREQEKNKKLRATFFLGQWCSGRNTSWNVPAMLLTIVVEINRKDMLEVISHVSLTQKRDFF